VTLRFTLLEPAVHERAGFRWREPTPG